MLKSSGEEMILWTSRGDSYDRDLEKSGSMFWGTEATIGQLVIAGTNVRHGTAFEYVRNSAPDARNFFDVGSSPPPFKRNQFGGVLGGPIKKDKTFFFGGYEGLRQGLGTTLIATVPTALARQGILPTGTVPVNPAVVPYLNLYPAPNGRDFGNGTAEFLSAPTVVTKEDYSMVPVDHQLNAKTGIFGRYTFDTDSLNAPQNLPNFFQVTASRRQYTTLQANSILSSKALNNFRYAFNRTHHYEFPAASICAPDHFLNHIFCFQIQELPNDWPQSLGEKGQKAS